MSNENKNYLSVENAMEILGWKKSKTYNLRTDRKIDKILGHPIRSVRDGSIKYLEEDVQNLKTYYVEASAKTVICMVQNKGGNSKTTSTLYLGHALAEKGKRVLLIDFDAQANLTYVLSTDKDKNPLEYDYSLFSIFNDPSVTLIDCIYPTRIGNLSFVPSDERLSELSLMERIGRSSLKTQLDEIGGFDYVIIDTPPYITEVTHMALNASTHALIPYSLDAFSMQGIPIVQKVINAALLYNEALNILGIFPTRVNNRLVSSKVIKDSMPEDLPLLQTEIPEEAIVSQAHIARETIYEYAPKSKVAQAYSELAEEILNV